jgi:hypothetical protein
MGGLNSVLERKGERTNNSTVDEFVARYRCYRTPDDSSFGGCRGGIFKARSKLWPRTMKGWMQTPAKTSSLRGLFASQHAVCRHRLDLRDRLAVSPAGTAKYWLMP